MRPQPQQLQKRQRGAVAVVVGIAIFVLVGMIGLALDLGQMFVNKTELQNAADACALAAARELDGNADALTRADAAGVLVGTQNLVGFQKTAVALTAADISYSEQLSPNSTYKTSAASSAGEAKEARFAMCQVKRSNIKMWFMGVRGFGDQTVAAYAVATLAPSQTTCAIPIGLCEANSSPPMFGLVPGKWYGGKFSAGTPGSTGSYDWIDFNPNNGGGANELKDLLAGPGQCELPPVGTPVGEQGQIASLTDAWNTRFGIYKGAYKISDIATIPPDFSGVAYTKVGVGNVVATTWPNTAPENAYSGTPSSGTTTNYQSAKTARTPYQSDDPAGVVPGGGTSIASQSELAQYGAQRRVALVPVVNCSDLANTNPQPVQLQGYACVLMLSPIKGPEDVVMEYLGDPNAAGSPCASYGLAGGTAGPLVPVLVQ
jgi:hypothetical protein